MRPVPSRSRSRLGATATIPAALEWLRMGEKGARYPTEALVEANPFVDEGTLSDARSYADFVWLAIRLVKDAGIEAKKASPSEAALIDEAVERAVTRILQNFSPGTERVRRLTQLEAARPIYPVSFNALQGLLTSDGAGAFFGTAYGAKAPASRALLQSLIAKLTALGNEVGFYAGGKQGAGPLVAYQARAMGTGEDMGAAVERWVAESKAREAAREAAQRSAAVPLSPTMPLIQLPTSTSGPSTALTMGPASASAGPGGGSAPPPAAPSWVMPALVATAAAGIALLVLPNLGSPNRGSRARNLDYGSIPSDAKEGRMIRGTLRNLETDARAMRQMLEDDDDLPQWVHSKVQTSADRVNSAHRYLRAKIQAK